MEPAAVIRRLRPSSALPFILWAALFIMQIISPDRAWSWPLVGLSVMLLFSYLWARMLRDRVTARREARGAWVVVGDQLVEQFTLTNRGQLPVLWARCRDESGIPGYQVERVETAPGMGERTWSTTGVCQRRGVFRLGPWRLEMADPLGLFEVTQEYPQTSTIMVYPRAANLPSIDLPHGRAAGRATSAERAAAETITVGGVRSYAHGDSLRRVHWPTTARRDELMVREFDREPSGDVWLILDMDAAVQAGRDAEATPEYAVVLAASLAARITRGGERRGVGLVMSGRNPQFLAPGRGQAQLWQILGALAEAEPAPGLPLAALLRQASANLGSGRTLVVITPSQAADWVASLLPLSGRGNAPVALLLDATTFEPPAGAPAGLVGLRDLLARQRIPNYVIAQGFPFKPVERIRRQRRELRSLPGFGRVVAVDVTEEV